MSTDPVSGEVTQYSPPGQHPAGPQQRPPRTALVPGPSVGALVGATVTLLLGVLLGVANQGATGTSMNLRVPALLAALLMVGQGVVDFRRGLVAKPTVERIPDEEPARIGSELPAARGASGRTSRQNVSVMPSVKPTASTLAVPVVVLVLAAWLGWADLVTSAPDSLAVLSLIAAFALFALGWSLLPTRH